MEIFCTSCSSENAYFDGTEYLCPDCDFNWIEKNIQNQVRNEINYNQKTVEALYSGYAKNLEKLIDQVIASAKTKFNYSALLSGFPNYNEEKAEIFADYLLRVIVIEIGTALDKESGLENCLNKLVQEKFPLSQEDIKKIAEMLYTVLKMEFGAIQKLNYLSRELTPIEVMIEKINKEVEIKTNDLGQL